MAEMTLDLPEELISELERLAEKSGKSVSDLVLEALKLYFRQRPVRKPRGDISGRSEVQQAIRLQAETRHRLEGFRYSGSAAVHEIRDRDD